MISGTVTVGTTPTLIFESINRPGVVLENSGATPVFLGTPTVAATGANAGPSLAAGGSLVLPFIGAVFGVVASGTTTVAFLAEG